MPHKRLMAASLVAMLVLGCGPRAPSLRLAEGQTAAAPVWSPGGRCAAIQVDSRDGHSPLTTSFVAVAQRGERSYHEIRFPAPDDRFSTRFAGWESATRLRVTATTLDAERTARYDCATGKLEVLP